MMKICIFICLTSSHKSRLLVHPKIVSLV